MEADNLTGCDRLYKSLQSRYTAESESKLSVKSMLKSMRAENSKFAKELLSQGARVPEYVFNVINPEKSSPIQKSMSKIINAAKVPEVTLRPYQTICSCRCVADSCREPQHKY